MKNAMKKLLSLVLVAMLLVSVVPLGAMAAEGDVQPNVSVTVKSSAGTDTVVPVQTKWLDSTQTVGSVLEGLYSYDASRYVVSYNWNGTDYDESRLSDLVTDRCTNLDFTLTKRSAPVTIALDGVGSATKYYDMDTVLTLDASLLATFNLTPTSGKEIDRWTADRSQESITTYTVDGSAVTLTCYQKASGNPNGGSTTTSHAVTFFDVNGNNIWSIDVANGSNVDTADNSTATQVTYAEQNVGTKAGYTFAGWQINKTGTVYSTQSASLVPITGATNFYPVFTQNSAPSTTKYTVRFFDANNANHWTIEVDAGSTIDIADNNSTTKIGWAESNVGVKSGHTFSGWRKNGEGETLSTATVAQLAINSNTSFYPVFTKDSSSSSNSGSTKFVNDIYLNIYLNGKVDSPAKSVKLNGYTIISDDVINLTEVLTVVDDYYTAVDANKGLILDGLYLTKGNFVSNYATDSGKSSSIGDLTAKRYESTVGINVMVTNAKAKTSSTADSSNPKTGDAIFAPVAVLTLSTAALAAVYFISKKRVVR